VYNTEKGRDGGKEGRKEREKKHCLTTIIKMLHQIKLQQIGLAV
jgi:hypothetical protein